MGEGKNETNAYITLKGIDSDRGRSEEGGLVSIARTHLRGKERSPLHLSIRYPIFPGSILEDFCDPSFFPFFKRIFFFTKSHRSIVHPLTERYVKDRVQMNVLLHRISSDDRCFFLIVGRRRRKILFFL